MVELHSQEIIDESGQVSVLCADLRDPDSILDHPAVRELIDPAEPTGLLLTAVLMFVADADDPWGLVARYLRELRSGSYLSLSHLTDDAKPPLAVDGFRRVFDHATQQMHFRSKAQVARFFDGLELVPPYQGAMPALTYSGLWGAEDVQMADSDGSRWLYCAVAESRNCLTQASWPGRQSSSRRRRNWASTRTRWPGSGPVTAMARSRSRSRSVPGGRGATGC
jgi:hypothetical protein